MITLDGVMQGPGGPTEDPSEGFEYGGWVAPYDDEVYDRVVEKELKPADYLLGRKTYEIWADYWPKHADTWPGINAGTKYVLSKTLKKSDWKNSVFLDSIEEIKRIKNTKGADIQVWGSSEIVQLLLKHDLVDELKLKIHPLILGNGKKLFDNSVLPSAFTLVESIITPSGVIIAHYKRAGEVQTGTVGSQREYKLQFDNASSVSWKKFIIYKEIMNLNHE